MSLEGMVDLRVEGQSWGEVQCLGVGVGQRAGSLSKFQFSAVDGCVEPGQPAPQTTPPYDPVA